MTIPIYLDTHTAIVGASGAGKTVTAKDMVESLLDANRHVCIVDPTGVWHGLRTSADGVGPGFPIPIFGGQHGDIGIAASQGDAIGEIIAGGVSAVVDLSLMADSDEQIDFVLAMVKALRRKPRANFHLVVDECEEFSPQTAPSSAGQALIREMTWVAKRGRAFGFVLTAITQRPADISKSVLSQMQTLMAHQLILPHDQDAVKAYLRSNGDKATLDQIMRSLPSLQRGERWIYSPRIGLLERGVSPMPATFDSSRTPAPGEAPIEPKLLASIDIEAIRKALAVEEAPTSPSSGASSSSEAGLLARIAELEAEQAEWTVERGYGQQQLNALKNALGRVAEEARGIANFAEQMIDNMHDAIGENEGSAKGGGGPEVDDGQTEGRPPVSVAPRAKPQRQRHEPQEVTAGETAALPAGTRPMLGVLASVYPAGMTKGQLAARLGIKKKGTTLASYMSRLRTASLIDERDGLIFASKSGAVAVGPIEALPEPGPELARSWAAKLAGTPPLVEHLLTTHPAWQDRGQIAEALGINPTGTTIASYISRLFTAGVVEKVGVHVRLSAEVMGAPLPGESD